MKHVLFLYLSLVSVESLSQEKRKTSPQPPVAEARQFEEWNISTFVPISMEKLLIVVKGEAWGKVYHPSEVPLFDFVPGTGRVDIGTIPVGTEVIPKFVRRVSGRYFYAIENSEAKGKTAWIDGEFLQVKGRKDS